MSKIPASISNIEPASALASMWKAAPAVCPEYNVIFPSAVEVLTLKLSAAVIVISSAASTVISSPAFISILPASEVNSIDHAPVP